MTIQEQLSKQHLVHLSHDHVDGLWCCHDKASISVPTTTTPLRGWAAFLTKPCTTLHLSRMITRVSFNVQLPLHSVDAAISIGQLSFIFRVQAMWIDIAHVWTYEGGFERIARPIFLVSVSLAMAYAWFYIVLLMGSGLSRLISQDPSTRSACIQYYYPGPSCY